MRAMVFAAGFGTRLRPITDSIPKALVSVAGEPVLSRVIRRLVDAGAEEVVVNVHHFADKIVEYLDGHDFGVPVLVSREEQPNLETGGGIKHAAPLLGDGRFLVHNVDILSDVDLRALIDSDKAFAKEDGSPTLATLCVREAEADRYLLFDDGLRLVGWTNVRTGQVKSPYPDFDPSRYRGLSFCGIQIMSPEVHRMMENWPDAFSIIDFYLAACIGGRIRAVQVPEETKLIDIGSPESLALAEKTFREVCAARPTAASV